MSKSGDCYEVFCPGRLMRLETGKPTVFGGQREFGPGIYNQLPAEWNLPGSARKNDSDPVYVFLERIDRTEFRTAANHRENGGLTFEHEDLIERIRIFGPQADMENPPGRNDALYWRIISEEDIQPTDSSVSHEPFLRTDPEPQNAMEPVVFFARPIELLLWGRRDATNNEMINGDRLWYDERVAASKVTYPFDDERHRIYIRGTEYIREGMTQFVRWRDLVGTNDE